MSLGLDMDFDDVQRAIGDTIEQFCRDHCSDAQVKAWWGELPRDAWRDLAELGVLALGTPYGEGGPIELVAALEPLGRAVFPGPLAATFLATQILPASDARPIALGEAVVSVSNGSLRPWGPHADIFIEFEGTHAWRGEPSGPIEPVRTVGGEPWGRVELRRTQDLGDAAAALALHDAALAAFTAAAGTRLVSDAAEHARTRVQFGRAIGEFQAVALPLAQAQIQLGAAAALARAAAWEIDSSRPTATIRAAAARVSASKAGLLAAYTCHQSFGAMGAMLEGPVFYISRRLRQIASQPPTLQAARDALWASL